MHVGIYNRWLATLGGGEKYCLTLAEVLSRKHEVEVISHTRVPDEQIQERLNVDVSQVKFVVLADRIPLEMKSVTAEYDFFINSSYMDFFPSAARYSANVIYFPTPIDSQRIWRRRAKAWLQRFFCLPDISINPQSFNLSRGSQDWFSDGEIKVNLPSHHSAYNVQFNLRSCQLELRKANLLVDGQMVAQVDFAEADQPEKCLVQVPGSAKGAKHELWIQPSSRLMEVHGQPQLAVSQLQIDLLPYSYYQHWLAELLSRRGMRLEYNPARVSPVECIDTYSAIWAISEFSNSWIERYWHRHSEILLPPVDVELFSASVKSPTILSVGRFFTGNHNKRHQLLISSFKQMVDRGLKGWTLHLAGGTTPGKEHEAYLKEVYEKARGYPIEIHPDISFSELCKLYSTASIYWHASGYGENESRHPEKFEHFGITTVEAMASGCVPIVIAKGGQPEIVQSGQNGFLWNHPDELMDLTWRVMKDDSLRKSLSQKALEDSRKYGKDVFSSRLEVLMRGYQ